MAGYTCIDVSGEEIGVSVPPCMSLNQKRQSYRHMMCLSVCYRSLGSDQHLPVVPGRGRSHVRHAGGVAVSVPGCRPAVGVRWPCMPSGRLRGGHTVECQCVYVHVDKCRPLSSNTQTPALWNSADEDPMSVLDGVYLDLGSHVVLSPVTWRQQAGVWSRCLHLYARLGEYGRVFRNSSNSYARPEPHHHHVHIFLYLLNDAKTSQWGSYSRQRVRDSSLGKPIKS